jgi:hypothetical protein
MAVFHVNIINHTLPALSVTVADSGVPPVTYQQVKNSLGSYVYKIDGIYLYSENMNQLIGVIQYNRFDVNGDEKFTQIVTTIDPYQLEHSLFKDLKGANTAYILNGNSSLSTTILPQVYLQLKMYTKRITSSFGRNLGAFKLMELIDRKPDFFANYGDYNGILLTNEQVEKTATLTNGQDYVSNPNSLDGSFVFDHAGNNIGAATASLPSAANTGTASLSLPSANAAIAGATSIAKKGQTELKSELAGEHYPVLIFSVAAISVGMYLLNKKD